jgi:hypothetical protein
MSRVAGGRVVCGASALASLAGPLGFARGRLPRRPSAHGLGLSPHGYFFPANGYEGGLDLGNSEDPSASTVISEISVREITQ